MPNVTSTRVPSADDPQAEGRFTMPRIRSMEDEAPRKSGIDLGGLLQAPENSAVGGTRSEDRALSCPSAAK